ncbi:MAG TPA: hypothetical protein VNL91_03865 [Thermoanaerobaculia bacterium]|nr:hypothetical protein [Thermoanaerobaculia bacterium]
MVFVVVMAATTSACAGKSASTPQMSSTDRDVRALAKRVSTLESELLEAQKKLVRDHDEREQLRRRVVAIESLFADRLSEQAASATGPQVQPEPEEKRGGFADFSKNSPPEAASAVPLSPPQSPSPRGPQIVVIGGGGGSDADIKRLCEQEWGTNFRMRSYCEEQHVEAKERINARSASNTGVSPLDFEAIRRHCQQEWPGGNYRMQDYCESEQVKAARRVRG